MTGFGKSFGNLNNVRYEVEIRSLNSKQVDLYIRMPNLYKQHELEVRNLLAQRLSRGKIELNLNVHGKSMDALQIINTDLAVHYHKELKQLLTVLGEKNEDLLPVILKIPEVMTKNTNTKFEPEEWTYILSLIDKAIEDHIEYRETEGASLEDDLRKGIDAIGELLTDVENHEPVRIDSIRDRINKGMENISKIENFDQNRHAQEMIYYIEKLDINEEKVRLKAHIKYFSDTMKTGDVIGKNSSL